MMEVQPVCQRSLWEQFAKYIKNSYQVIERPLFRQPLHREKTSVLIEILWISARDINGIVSSACLLLHLQEVRKFVIKNSGDTSVLGRLCGLLENVVQTGWVGKYEHCLVQCNKVTSCNSWLPSKRFDGMRWVEWIVGAFVLMRC